ncbi:DMT family transporter [Cupriavidus basilensis]
MNSSKQSVEAVALLIASVAFFAAFDTVTKYVSTGVPLVMALWFRYLFQVVSTIAALLPRRGRSLLRTRRPKLQLVRGLLLLLTGLFAFVSLRHMPVGEVTAIAMLTPLVITLVAAVLFGEKVSVQRWVFMAGGFVGAMMVIRPGGEIFGWQMLLPLGLVAASAGFQVVTSRLAIIDDAGTTHFYTGFVGAVLLTAALPFGWQPIGGLTWWLLMILMGVLSTLGHLLLIMAYARAPAVELTPYLFLQIGFAVIGGWLIFSYVPDRWSAAGIATIVACGATGSWIVRRERHALVARK